MPYFTEIIINVGSQDLEREMITMVVFNVNNVVTYLILIVGIVTAVLFENVPFGHRVRSDDVEINGLAYTILFSKTIS